MPLTRVSRPKPSIVVALGLLALSAGARRAEAQFEPPRVFGGALAASWIAARDAPGNAFGVFHFRRVLELPARPERFIVHVSADNRYRFFVNGTQVSSGPQRSDLMHWRYETLDLAPHLRAGRNVLAALVWNWGPHRPVAQFSRHTAFLLQGDSEREAVASTGREWKVLQERGLRANSGDLADGRRLLRGSAGRGRGRQPLSLGLGAGRLRRRGLASSRGRRRLGRRACAASRDRDHRRGHALAARAALDPAHGGEGGAARAGPARLRAGAGRRVPARHGGPRGAGADEGHDPARQRPPHERLCGPRDERRERAAPWPSPTPRP